MSADEVYSLTVEVGAPVTLTRDWEDLSTTRDPGDQEPYGEVTFPVIPGGYYLSAEGYEDLHIEEVNEDMTVALEEESADGPDEYEEVGEELDNELNALKERLRSLEARAGIESSANEQVQAQAEATVYEEIGDELDTELNALKERLRSLEELAGIESSANEQVQAQAEADGYEEIGDELDTELDALKGRIDVLEEADIGDGDDGVDDGDGGDDGVDDGDDSGDSGDGNDGDDGDDGVGDGSDGDDGVDDGGGEASNDITVSIDYEQLAGNLSEYLQDGRGRSDEEIVQLIQEHDIGLSEEETRALIEEHGGSSGGLTEEDVRTIIEESDVDSGYPPGFHVEQLDTSDLPTNHNYYVLLGKENHNETHLRINGTLRGYRGRSSAFANDAIEILGSANDKQQWALSHSKVSPSPKAPDTQFVTVDYDRDGETYIALECAVENYRNYNGQLVFQGLLHNASLEVYEEDDVSNVEPVPEGMLRGTMTHDRPGTSGGSGGGSGDVAAELEDLRRERERFSLVGMPDHTRTIVTGDHEDDGFHPHGSWGLVVTAHEDVVWRKAVVNADSAGSTQLEIFEMDYEKDETYEVGDRIKTHEVAISGSGDNSIHPDIVLEAGRTFFITRDTAAGAGDALPLKRSVEEADWGTINDNDIPMTIHCTWQRGRGQPGTQEFQDYRDANWHRTLHYYRDLEFGFNEEA